MLKQPKVPPTVEVNYVPHQGVYLRAASAEEIAPGEWKLMIPVKILTDQQHEMLESLFPHCAGEISTMLDRETLIAAMIK